MADLPVILQPGYVLVYGNGSPAGVSGVTAQPNNFLFGQVHQVWGNGTLGASVGDYVMFNDKDRLCTLFENNVPYTMIEEARLVLKEISPP